MSNFIYYEKLQDYEEQVRKAKEYDKLQQELQRKDNEIKQLQEDIVNHIKIASEYKEQMIIKDNIINELNKDLEYYKHEEELYRYYQQENPKLMNNWNELKKYLEVYNKNEIIKLVLDKIKELEK